MTQQEIKKTNKRKIKSYREQLKSEIFDIENELTFSETGEAQIDCKVGKIENIFSSFDIAKNRTINDSFNTYLMQETEIIPVRHNLEIRLHLNNNTTPEQEEQLKKAIKRHYSFTITTINVKLYKNLISALLLYFGGIVSLILNVLTSNWITILPIDQTLLIATWFFVWEGTAVAFFERSALKLKRYDMLRIYNAKMTVIREDIEN